MRSGSKIAVVLLLLTIFAIGFIDVSKKQTIDWNRSYDQRDKIPFGLYVARMELSNILTSAAQVSDISNLSVAALAPFKAKPSDKALLFIVDQYDFSTEVNTEIYRFAEAGGEVFISANSMPEDFLDSLALHMEYLDYSKFDNALSTHNLGFFLMGDKQPVYYKELEYPGLFSKLDADKHAVVGTFQIQKQPIPNFVEVRVGKGKIWIHLEPLMFTNFYMLQNASYVYAASALQLLQNKDVYWYDAYKKTELSSSPLRFLLTNPGLRQAWYLLLSGMVLYLLFRSKREQAAVVVVKPEVNQSKNFAKAIASLYYENAKPGNMAQKKIDYFLFDLRRYYQLDYLQLEDESFAEFLSKKSGVSFAETKALVEELILGKAQNNISVHDLKRIAHRIEEFKIKAQMV